MRKPEEFTFYDGNLYIISCVEQNKNGLSEFKWSIDVIFLSLGYDEPLTLEKIKEKYPNVQKVMFDEAMQGYVFTYNNYGDNKWHQTGETRGYA
jgi:hypothetical protein